MKRAEGVLLIVEEADQPYLSRLGGALSSCKVKVYNKCPTTLTEIVMMGKKAGLTHFVTTRQDTLVKLLPPDMAKKAKISNYAGSIIPFYIKDEKFTFLILHPLKQLISVPYGEFLAKRYLSKLTAPAKWRTPSSFEFKICTEVHEMEEAEKVLATCDLIGTDIETSNTPYKHITMVGYTGVKVKEGTSHSFVIPMKSMDAVYAMRRINDLDIPKVLQNGKYDSAWFFAYSAPLRAYLYDTVNAFHSWYCELPKDLGMVTSFFLRDSMYWKDLADSGDFVDKCRYNAIDTWATVESFLSWLAEAPDWAKRNYVMEFSVVPACHMCEMTGIKRDMELLTKYAAAAEDKQDALLKSLRTMVATPNFNPSSPKQVLALLHILGEKRAESSDEKSLVAASYKHPLNERILGQVLEYRGERKLSSTYLTVGDKAKEFGSTGKFRILYSINPHGTDTGRCASKEHHFWCGLQVQNIPGDSVVKETLTADEGFELYEADLSQAEDRGVANKSGDPTLLAVFASGKDSHKVKASMFFGVPVEEITKDQRNLGKRINHGANYNMGAYVLVETMGPKAIREAQRLLGLPKHWDLKGVATHLLNIYSNTFPVVKDQYYKSIVKDVKITSKLVGDTGWTRFCFGDPVKNKLDLNAYVAHVTQSLNAMNLNKAFLAVFRELAFDPDFKLLAQIHDSILFQVRKGRHDLAVRVQELMTFAVPVTDCFGVTRDMVVPVDLKRLGATWKGEAA